MIKYKLNNGLEIPAIGFGTYLMKPDDCENAVGIALKDGYRSIDTANIYMNERAVGRAIKASGLKREEIFLTSKIFPCDFGYEKTKKAIDATLRRLDTNYLDLLLLHQKFGDVVGAWKAMEEAVESGKLKSIGVSNFDIKRLEFLMENTKIKPQVNQVECHPYNQQKELKEFHSQHGIVLEAWYPIGHGRKDLIANELFSELGKKYGKSNVQIILKWHLQYGNRVLPKSLNPSHIKENLELFDFELTPEEMKQIEALDKDKPYLRIPDFIGKIFFKLIRINYDKQK